MKIDKTEAAALYAQGESLRTIAGRYGASHNAVAKALERQGAPRRSLRSQSGARSPRWRADIRERADAIVTLYRRGATLEEVAAVAGCSALVVRKVLIEHGVERRSKGCRVSVPPAPAKRAPAQADLLTLKPKMFMRGGQWVITDGIKGGLEVVGGDARLVQQHFALVRRDVESGRLKWT